jgi:hypothetical protein
LSDAFYRDNPRTTTLELLDRMERQHTTRRGRAMAWASQARLVREGGPVTHAGPITLRAAKALELTHVGAVSEANQPREVWVDASRAHQLHDMIRRSFFVVTYFDDATAVLTYGMRDPTTPSHERLLVRRGSAQDPEATYVSHVDSAKRWSAARHTSPLVVEDAATAARMVRHYYLIIAPRSFLFPMVAARVIG